jgi:hypothetical protein
MVGTWASSLRSCLRDACGEESGTSGKVRSRLLVLVRNSTGKLFFRTACSFAPELDISNAQVRETPVQ